MAETPIIKEGMNGFYPWAKKEKIPKNPYANDIGLKPNGNQNTFFELPYSHAPLVHFFNPALLASHTLP